MHMERYVGGPKGRSLIYLIQAKIGSLTLPQRVILRLIAMISRDAPTQLVQYLIFRANTSLRLAKGGRG